MCVVLTHSMSPTIRNHILFPLWGNPAVPLFLIIQVFHSYKKGLGNVSVNFGKLWKRVISPFVMVHFIITFLYLTENLLKGNFEKDIILGQILGHHGGKGVGSYYPLIHVQFAILLPIWAPLFRRLSRKTIAIIFLLFSQMIEILCCWLSIPDLLYHLSFWL